MYVAAPLFGLSVLIEFRCQRWCFRHVKICLGLFHFSSFCLFLLLARAHGLLFLCICVCLRPMAGQLRLIFVLRPWWFSDILCSHMHGSHGGRTRLGPDSLASPTCS